VFQSLWEKSSTCPSDGNVPQSVVESVATLIPKEGRPEKASGWSDVVFSLIYCCRCANGTNSSRNAFDAAGCAYQAVLKKESKPFRLTQWTEKEISEFELRCGRCLAEIEFQLNCLDELEGGSELKSRLFSVQ